MKKYELLYFPEGYIHGFYDFGKVEPAKVKWVSIEHLKANNEYLDFRDLKKGGREDLIHRKDLLNTVIIEDKIIGRWAKEYANRAPLPRLKIEKNGSLILYEGFRSLLGDSNTEIFEQGSYKMAKDSLFIFYSGKKKTSRYNTRNFESRLSLRIIPSSSKKLVLELENGEQIAYGKMENPTIR